MSSAATKPKPKAHAKENGKVAQNGQGKRPAGQQWGGKSYDKPQNGFAKKRKAEDGADVDGKQPPNKRHRAAPGGGAGGESDAKSKILTKKDRKELRKTRKAAKPHYDVVQQLNVVFATDLKKAKKAEREEKVETIMAACKGKVMLVATRHDASRAFQSLIKYGSDGHRDTIATEIAGKVVDLCKNHYGHFIVLKLLQYGKPELKSKLMKELEGHLPPLALHTDAAKVVDYWYASCKPVEQLRVLEEFYHPEFVKFKTEQPRTLEAIMEQEPAKLQEILDHMRAFLEKAAGKQMFMFRYIHTLLHKYLTLAPLKQARTLVEIVSKLLPALHHSRDGVLAAIFALSYGTVKDRKAMVKAIKGNIKAYAMHEHGHMMIIRALDVIDDTVLLNKSVINELTADLDSLLLDRYGAKVLLHLLSPRNKFYMSPADLSLLQVVMAPAEDDETKLVPTSKKDPAVRRAELLVAVMPTLLAKCIEHVAELPFADCGSKVLYETLLEAAVSEHVEKGAVASAFAKLCALVGEAQVDKNILQDRFGHMVLKRLLLNLQPDAHAFADVLFRHLQPSIGQWALRNRGAFVITALLERADADVVREMRQELGTSAFIKGLNKVANAPGCGILAKQLAGDAAAAPAVPAKKGKQQPADDSSSAPAPAPAKKAASKRTAAAAAVTQEESKRAVKPKVSKR